MALSWQSASEAAKAALEEIYSVNRRRSEGSGGDCGILNDGGVPYASAKGTRMIARDLTEPGSSFPSALL